jgi:hypothetical protein
MFLENIGDWRQLFAFGSDDVPTRFNRKICAAQNRDFILSAGFTQ